MLTATGTNEEKENAVPVSLKKNEAESNTKVSLRKCDDTLVPVKIDGGSDNKSKIVNSTQPQNHLPIPTAISVPDDDKIPVPYVDQSESKKKESEIDLERNWRNNLKDTLFDGLDEMREFSIGRKIPSWHPKIAVVDLGKENDSEGNFCKC